MPIPSVYCSTNSWNTNLASSFWCPQSMSGEVILFMKFSWCSSKRSGHSTSLLNRSLLRIAVTKKVVDGRFLNNEPMRELGPEPRFLCTGEGWRQLLSCRRRMSAASSSSAGRPPRLNPVEWISLRDSVEGEVRVGSWLTEKFG